MFGILDAANGAIDSTRPKTLASRACDQCKFRKVRCEGGNPCATCVAKGITCTYNTARKKRGPPSKRLSMQALRGRSSTVGGNEEANLLAGPQMQQLERVRTAPVSIGSMLIPEMAMDGSLDWTGSVSSQNEGNALSLQTFDQMATASEQPMQQDQSTATPSSAMSAMYSGGGDDMMASPNAYMFPSLPVESPSGINDPFAGIPEQDLPLVPEAADVWPSRVNEASLLPWIDVYFKRLHPTIPILSRTTMYCDMLLRKHRTDPQYGAMLLGLSAFAMTQPVQIHERSSMPSRSVQARMLMEECVKMRVAADFGENPTLEMVLTSFFLFACLFGSSQHKAARHRLREAVDLAYSLGMHLPDSYQGFEPGVREQWLRTYLVLSVTERAYALQQNHPINFRGRPGITARFMQAFGPSATDEYISSLIYQDQSDSVGMTGLLYLMDTFDAIDESVMDCWNGYCHFSDGICETFDRRRALQMFRAQRRVREACISGNISFAPNATPMPLERLFETQRADISVTQYWLLNRLWQLCLSHQLLRDGSAHPELRFDFACHVAVALLECCSRLTLSAMEVHGVGFAEKLYDVGVGVVTAVQSSTLLDLDSSLTQLEDESDRVWGVHELQNITVRQLLDKLRALLHDFRGGDHQFAAKLDSLLAMLSGYEA